MLCGRMRCPALLPPLPGVPARLERLNQPHPQRPSALGSRFRNLLLQQWFLRHPESPARFTPISPPVFLLSSANMARFVPPRRTIRWWHQHNPHKKQSFLPLPRGAQARTPAGVRRQKTKAIPRHNTGCYSSCQSVLFLTNNNKTSFVTLRAGSECRSMKEPNP